MAIHDIFSKRQKRLRGEVPDVYTYDVIPDTLRNQIVMIWDDHYSDFNLGARQKVVKIVTREYGDPILFDVPKSRFDKGGRKYSEELLGFVLYNAEAEEVLDAVELSLPFLSNGALVEELNHRFKEHGVGYQCEGDKVIRVDSQFIHQEAVKPALSLLSDPAYAGAQDEFLSAFEHYRHGKHKEAMTDACKAFESTMKTICNNRKWEVKDTASASQLIQVCYDNELIPAFWQNYMTGLRTTLEAGVPTGRNKKSAHGQGEVPTEVPDYLVSYVLHMTASAIVFLVKAEQALG